jgi:hypothetical protein
MRGTLVFVHGTGVRKDGWIPTWNRVQEHSRTLIGKDLDFIGCPWGPDLGVDLERVAQTLPADPATKAAAAGQPGPEEVDAALWALLIEDPLFELRLAVEDTAGPAPVRVGRLPPDQEALELLRGLAERAGELPLTGGEVPFEITATEIAAAARTVADSPELQNAAIATGDARDPGLVQAAARAVAATALAAHRTDPPGAAPAELYDAGRRDRLVALLAAALAPGQARGAFSWLKDKAQDFALRKATQIAVDRRRGLQGASTAPIGDILHYQRRGGAIAAYVAERLRAARPPVVAVGHSLGGIILVDLLSRADAPKVDLLVTAGSQAPMLYAIDALEQIRWGRERPAPFTPWLNIYNRQDFLSFCAARIFNGAAGIQDEEVDPGVPFPESHSAYWVHDKVYQLIRDAWPPSGRSGNPGRER